jgi:hypothetical protein
MCNRDENFEKHNKSNKDYYVVKGNLLNESKLDSKMKLVEYRILLIALSKISPLSESSKAIFSVSDFCDLFKLKKKGMYLHMKKCSENLASRVLSIENKELKRFKVTPWLRKIEYDSSYITIVFN